MSIQTKSLPSIFGKLLLMLWGVALTLAITCWGAWHYAALPGPAAGKVVRLAPSPATNQWRLVHVLAADCGCSVAVAKRLAERRALPGVTEEVWLVGESRELVANLQQSGFTVLTQSPELLAQDVNIEGVPWLLIVRGSGVVAYSGGYASRNPATVAQLEDVELLQRLQRGESPEAFPAFGCATSRRAKQSFDPLGLKYSSR